LKISVIIPAHNCEKTIGVTLKSVLAQTVLPKDIIVINDGSSDGTLDIARSFGSQITIIDQEQGGAASARNAGWQRATSELLAFIDADDVWHPRYLEIQCRAVEANPRAAAYFTGHVDFQGAAPDWIDDESVYDLPRYDVFSPARFVREYNHAAGQFASMSYCCVRRDYLAQIGKEPFQANGAEDTYLFHMLALYGNVIFNPACLAGYRISDSSLSSNRLRVVEALIKAFELLARQYREMGDPELCACFRSAFASKRREYAKLLIGAGLTSPGRQQLLRSVCSDLAPISMAKSLTLLLATCMPKVLQPKWPTRYRIVPCEASQTNE
jgi:glycosyltransferase involved in cell wall biosynthesis